MVTWSRLRRTGSHQSVWTLEGGGLKDTMAWALYRADRNDEAGKESHSEFKTFV